MKLFVILLVMLLAGGGYYLVIHDKPSQDRLLEHSEDNDSVYRDEGAETGVPTHISATPSIQAAEEEHAEDDPLVGDSASKPNASSDPQTTDLPPPAETASESASKPLPVLIRETLEAQRAIPVPHAFDSDLSKSDAHYDDAVVYRVDPDGIHIRHAAGLVKILMEDMKPAGRDRYHMHPRVASAYRERQAQQDQKAWRAAQERLRLDRIRHGEALERNRQEREARLAEQARERAARDLQRRRQAWAQYDRDYQAWRTSAARTDRNVTGRAAPTPPPFPRPGW
jgi:hypothetical protein